MADCKKPATMAPSTANNSSSHAHWILLICLSLVPAACAIAFVSLVLLKDTGSSSDYYRLSLNGAIILLLSTLSVLASFLAATGICRISLYPRACAALTFDPPSKASEHTRHPGFDDDLSEDPHINARHLIEALTEARQYGTRQRTIPFDVIAGPLLTILVFVALAADLWLHVDTKINSMRMPSVTTDGFFGREIKPICLANSHVVSSYQVPIDKDSCQANTRPDLVNNSSDASQTAAGLAQSNQVLTLSSKYGELSILAGIPGATAFVANSFGVGTSCSVLSTYCTIDAAKGSYNCPDYALAGTLDQPLSVSAPRTSEIGLAFAAALLITGSERGLSKFNHNSELSAVSISEDGHDMIVVMNCTSQAYNVSYLYDSGILTAHSVEVASTGVTSLILNPMFPGQIHDFDSFGTDFLVTGTRETALSAETLDVIASSFANHFRHAAIASSIGIMQQSGPGDETSKNQSFTLLPKAPFWLLVIMDFCVSLLGLGFGLFAAIVTINGARMGNVQARLVHEGVLVMAAAYMETHLRLGAARVNNAYANGGHSGVESTSSWMKLHEIDEEKSSGEVVQLQYS